MYTKNGRKCINNGKIVPEYGVAVDNFGYSVTLSESTDLVCTPLVVDENCGSAYIVDNNAYVYLKRVYAQIRLGGRGGS